MVLHGTDSYPANRTEVLVNDASLRDDAIKEFIAAARKDIAEGTIVILGGDFNPHTLIGYGKQKDLYDHNGLIIPWTVPLMLDNNGFIDTYRTLYPDVLSLSRLHFSRGQSINSGRKA